MATALSSSAVVFKPLIYQLYDFKSKTICGINHAALYTEVTVEMLYLVTQKRHAVLLPNNASP